MMERFLLGVLYLSGLTGWSIFSTCRLLQYHFVDKPMNWTEAQTYCRETYTDLVTIENTEDMNQLINTVSSAGNKSLVWIGLYRDPDINWSDGSDYSFTRWNGSASESLMKMMCGVQESNQWTFMSCKKRFSSVCYSIPPGE
ncbi:snaclec stejaggregin-B subunit beta-1-like [Thunnus albacares]|uniref:snaclec stejaggregin-B subunit beta-1-like n=1 Tax=Thunnus albacares TaxID=8236 RepID=UPI001CF63D35|nr:snaclec stejaggregin-B subunit beta-1-like [Thunnus albacares]